MYKVTVRCMNCWTINPVGMYECKECKRKHRPGWYEPMVAGIWMVTGAGLVVLILELMK